MNTQRSDDGWARLGLVPTIALVAAGTFPAIGLFSMGAALPAIEAGFAGTANAALMVQIMIGMVAPLFALASPLAGRLVERHGVRNVYLVSLALFLIGGLGPALCTSLWAMMPFRVILALAIAGAATAGYAGIARVPDKRRQILLGMLNFAGGGISIAAFPIVGQLATQDWRLAFLVHLIVVPLGLTALFLPGRTKPATADAAQAGGPDKAGALAGVPAGLLIISAVAGWAMVGSSIYSPVYLSSIGLSDPARIGQVLAVMAMASLAGSGSYGFVHRFFGTRGMMLLGLALSGCGCALVGSSGTVVWATVGLGLLGTGLAIFVASAFAAAIDAIGPAGHVGAAMGIMNLAIFGPQIVFPPIATAIGSTAGPPMVYFLLAGLYAASIVLAIVGRLGVARPAPQPATSI
jgi:MFS family permease